MFSQHVQKLQIPPVPLFVETGGDAWGSRKIMSTAVETGGDAWGSTEIMSTAVNYRDSVQALAIIQSASYSSSQTMMHEAFVPEYFAKQNALLMVDKAKSQSIILHNTVTSRNPKFQAGFCGLEVTEKPPHRVLAIDDLVDEHFVQQGASGYSNPIVMPGDRIIKVSGRSAEHVSVKDLHGE